MGIKSIFERIQKIREQYRSGLEEIGIQAGRSSSEGLENRLIPVASFAAVFAASAMQGESDRLWDMYARLEWKSDVKKMVKRIKSSPSLKLPFEKLTPIDQEILRKLPGFKETDQVSVMRVHDLFALAQRPSDKFLFQNLAQIQAITGNAKHLAGFLDDLCQLDNYRDQFPLLNLCFGHRNGG